MKTQTSNDQDQAQTLMNYRLGFQAFLNEEVEKAIDCATNQEYGGTSTTVLEIFPDGTYRWEPSQGNQYDSPGIVIGIPSVNQSDDEEYDEDGELLVSRFYDNSIENVKEFFEDLIEDIIRYSAE